MVGKKSILAIIPARGGSKGVPRKNIKNLAGKPLIVWTIEAAKKSKYIDRLILSSEDDEIIGVAQKYGCEVPFKRPDELSQDDTPSIAPILHVIEQIKDYDYILLLQPTSPLRTVEDIDGAIEYLFEKKATSCVSVVEAEQSPYWMYNIVDEKLEKIISQENIVARRQELPLAYMLNGAIYLICTKELVENKSFINQNTIAYKMSREHSLDIDTQMDFSICELLLE